MSLSVGIVGLPNSGKSTLFNALLSRQIAQVASYPFTTIEPHEGVVAVPDERLEKLVGIVKPQKFTPATVTFIDIAGLVKDAHKGEGLGNQFLAKIREVDTIVQVVRAFKNPDVRHYYQTVDSQRDIEIVNLELELGEIQKPVIYVLNVDEEQISAGSAKAYSVSDSSSLATELVPIVHRDSDIHSSRSAKSLPSSTSDFASPDATPLIICAKLEMELADLEEEERREYLKELGIRESGLEKLISQAYKILGLITFYTIKGGKEVRAWSLKDGSTAFDAAAKVHTDFAKNFIKAEIINIDELLEIGGWQKAKEAGKIRLEGRDYVVQDGDVIEFKIGR